MTQDAACEPNGKPASFWGFRSVFWGASVWTEGRRQKDEKKQRRGGYSHNDDVLQFDFTVKSFPGISVGKHDRGLL